MEGRALLGSTLGKSTFVAVVVVVVETCCCLILMPVDSISTAHFKSFNLLFLSLSLGISSMEPTNNLAQHYPTTS